MIRVRLQTPAVLVLALLIAVVAFSMVQEGGNNAVVTVYTTDAFIEGDWNRNTIPPDRWIGVITGSEGWNRFPVESGYGDARVGVRPDFDTSLIIIAYMGMMPSEGHRVTIDQVTYTPAGASGLSRLDVRIHVASPGPGEMVAQVLTHPYETIIIAKDDLPPKALQELGHGTIIVDVVDQDGRVWGPGHIL